MRGESRAAPGGEQRPGGSSTAGTLHPAHSGHGIHPCNIPSIASPWHCPLLLNFTEQEEVELGKYHLTHVHQPLGLF